MLARSALVVFALAPLPLAQVVEKLNGPLAGNVSSFAWTPDGRYVIYGAALDDARIDVVVSRRVADGSEVVYAPYSFASGSIRVTGFVFPPAPGIVGAKYFLSPGFPSPSSRALHLVDRSSATAVTVVEHVSSQHFLDDGRMLYRTSVSTTGSGNFEYAWSGRWNVAASPLQLSPPPSVYSRVSSVLPAPRAGVAVFGWDESLFTSTQAELFAAPLDGGTPVALTPPPAAGLRDFVNVFHVRASDELVLYTADENPDVAELWAVPADGSLAPRRLCSPLEAGRTLYSPVVTPDEERIVFVGDVDTPQVYELWSSEVDSGASTRLSAPLVANGDVAESFWISPDGARVVYLADERVDGVNELLTVPVDGHAPAVRLHPALPASADALGGVRFTPDGRFVVFAVLTTAGTALLSAPSDASAAALSLNGTFPVGGGVQIDGSGFPVIALAPGGRHVFFLGAQDVAGEVALYSVPIDGSTLPHRWSAPLVAGGDVTAFAVRPSPGAVLYRADQDVDDHFELYLARLPEAPPPRAATGAPTSSVTVPGPP